jgi:hypothetical protein
MHEINGYLNFVELRSEQNWKMLLVLQRQEAGHLPVTVPTYAIRLLLTIYNWTKYNLKFRFFIYDVFSIKQLTWLAMHTKSSLQNSIDMVP